MIGTPPVRRRMLGAALRRYRESLGYTLEEAARVLACDRSKISRIETGHRGIHPGELRDLLAGYGVDEPGHQRALAALADPRAAGLVAGLRRRAAGSVRGVPGHRGDGRAGPGL